jgi:DNA-directed RNA polymerase I subunit RPA1
MDEEGGGGDVDEDETGAVVEAVVVERGHGDAVGGELSMKFTFDRKQRHAQLSFSVPAASKKLLMLEVLSKVSAGVVIREVPGIRSSFVIENTGEAIKVMTEGVNLSALPAMTSMIAVNKLRSSDIWAMMQAYGVEAGRACIVEEIGNVFASYGIAVNPRHLTLIADYMTFDGTYRPMNRLGMDWGEPALCHALPHSPLIPVPTGTSPLLKMSFETTTKFLSEATLYGDYDSLRSPSACIAVGRPIRCECSLRRDSVFACCSHARRVGTGAFELHNPLKY